MDSAAQKITVLSGIRPTGALHLGNYLGAVRECVRLTEDPQNNCHFFVADLHGITTRPDPQLLKRDRRLVVRDFLAAGLDPNQVTLFTQSSVPETCELAHILSCLTPVGELMRMHHFKEKRDDLEGHGIEANLGLLSYPVLMAADILGPQANIVPVGDDQRQHVEIARNLAERFNKQYGELFPIPEPRIHTQKRVPSLAGEGKMSKSKEKGVIQLDERPEGVFKKLKVAPTDPARRTRTDPGDPNKCNLYTLHGFVSSEEELREVATGCQTAGITCYECKTLLAKNVSAVLNPMQERRREIEALGDRYIDEILYEGGRKARARIAETVARAKDLAGIPAAAQPYQPRGAS